MTRGWKLLRAARHISFGAGFNTLDPQVTSLFASCGILDVAAILTVPIHAPNAQLGPTGQDGGACKHRCCGRRIQHAGV
jgi:hypothetical protein